MGEYLATLLVMLRYFALVLGAMTILEMLFGRDEQTIRERLRGIPFWAVHIPLGAAVALTSAAGFQALGIRPIVQLPASPVTATIGAILLFDFAFYWYHRFQHRFLWRWHAPHHSFRNLSAINSYHHWAEPFIGKMLMGLPLALIEWSTESIAWLALVLSVQTYVIHSQLRFDLGPLRRIVIGPQYHRIHHSTELQHRDRNFGGFTPLWDWLFGTAYFPKPGEYPPIGVLDFPEPSFRQWWLAPILWRPSPVMPARQGLGRAEERT